MVFYIFATLAEIKRDIISERTKAGLAAAKARSRMGGIKVLSAEAQKTAMAAETLYREGDISVQEICDQLSISKPTLYNYLRSRKVR